MPARLPPLPDEVWTLELGIDTNGSGVGITQHFHAQGSIAWGQSEAQEFVYGWGLFAEEHLLNCMPVESSFTTCRLSRTGSAPLVYKTMLPANSGAHGIPQSLNSALCLTWQCQAEGFQSRSHTRLPLPADAVADNKRTLHSDFWANYQLQADQYIAAFNGIVIGGFDPPVFVVVSRVQAGAARASAVYAPVVSGNPSLWVGTLQSRTRSARSSPSR